jgi:DNA adenine methylase
MPAKRRLIEPFVGAGSVFLAANYDAYVINDANPDLTAVWAALQGRPKDFVAEASRYFSPEHWSQDAYLSLRSLFNASTDTFERATLLPYLNRFGFNGLFRVNSRGAFNVPYGRPAALPLFPFDRMAAAAAKLQHCLVLNGDYGAAIEMVGVNDVVYCDPPYSASATGKSFTSYTPSGFDSEEHERLVDRAVAAVARGATVLISNHDTPQTRDLYRGWHIETLAVRRSMAADSSARRTASEVVAILPKP